MEFIMKKIIFIFVVVLLILVSYLVFSVDDVCICFVIIISIYDFGLFDYFLLKFE